MIRKNRIFRSIIIPPAILLSVFFAIGIAASADNTNIIAGENLKPGMTVKDAIDLLGPPESIKADDTGMVILSYGSLGLSLSAVSDGTVVERVHLQSAFKGKFSSGLGVGDDYREILSVYNQPDIMTKDKIEYSDLSMIFHLSQGKLVGADLYRGGSTLLHRTPGTEAGTYEDRVVETHEDDETETIEGKEPGVLEDENAETSEDEDAEAQDEYNVFDLYGFSVKANKEGVVITEIRPGSVAELGGLKAGERIRKAFYKGTGVRNIYTMSGLRAILKRAMANRKKYINILQNENHYYRVPVPKLN